MYNINLKKERQKMITTNNKKNRNDTLLQEINGHKYIHGYHDFINTPRLLTLVDTPQRSDPEYIRDILQKSLEIKTLTLAETAALLQVKNQQLLEEMKHTAGEVKRKVYDNRIVTFAPLYLSNLCVNNCLYCAFRKDNTAIKRRKLTPEEVKKETEVLAGQIGHKRLIVVYGEHPQSHVDYMVDTIQAIYSVCVKTKNGTGQIRRVNVNAAPLSVDDLKILRRAGLGTFQVFQETYHRDTYAQVHPAHTLKADYEWRLYCMHRAFEAGIDDVGIGALFGLYDWRFEVLGLVSHARELENSFGIGPHTISFPRLEPALNCPYIDNAGYHVNDVNFKRAVTVIRLAVPYTGMILTARECPDMRKETLPLGCTQTDSSSRIGIGSYSGKDTESRQQFQLNDKRSLDEVIRELANMGYITSFCTAGYRCGRTGAKIMNLLRSGKEGNFCKANAILTFQEWLDDFASEETKAVGEKIIQKEILELRRKLPAMYPSLLEYYNRICAGERDLYF